MPVAECVRAGHAAVHEIAQQLFAEKPVHQRRQELSTRFSEQGHGQLVEGQHVELKEHTPLFHRVEPFHPPRELLRRDDDGERAERLVLLERVDFSDEGVFEIGMEWAGDDREHDKIRLAENSKNDKGERLKIRSGSCPRIAQRSWAFRRQGPADPAVRPALHLGAHAVPPARLQWKRTAGGGKWDAGGAEEPTEQSSGLRRRKALSTSG